MAGGSPRRAVSPVPAGFPRFLPKRQLHPTEQQRCGLDGAAVNAVPQAQVRVSGPPRHREFRAPVRCLVRQAGEQKRPVPSRTSWEGERENVAPHCAQARGTLGTGPLRVC
jgi:hypothetical protein